MSKIRSNRIAEEIKRELAQLIRMELKDPRVKGLVSITAVDVTGDLRFAKIFFSCLGNEEEKEDVLNGLKKASGFLRSELGKKIRLRYIPELIFTLDESLVHGAKISSILSELNGDRNTQEERNAESVED